MLMMEARFRYDVRHASMQRALLQQKARILCRGPSVTAQSRQH
jgi:hypothetical protein